jgi:hypothetical protein
MKFQILHNFGNIFMYEIHSEKFSFNESYVVLKLNGFKKFTAHDIPNDTTQG